MADRALFLDRDGVINVDHGYVYQQESFEFIPEIFELCKKAQAAGYRIFVITNQAGIARGYYSVDDFNELTFWMVEEFQQRGIVIDKVYFCPHHPDKGNTELTTQCNCRKPEPGMILQAQSEFNIDITNSIFIGDKVTDMQAANAAGIKKNYLLASRYDDDESILATRIANLSEVLDVFENV